MSDDIPDWIPRETNCKVVQVQIPEGQFPGAQMHVQSDGKLFTITIPQGTKPGDVIAVEIHDEPHSEGVRMVRAGTNEAISSHEHVPDAPFGEEEAVGGNEPKTISRSKASLGAAGLGLVVGTLLIGPVTGVIVAGVALYASTRDDSVGRATVATGSATVRGYQATKDAAKKHGVYDRVKAAGVATGQRASEINEQYKVTDSIKSVATSTVNGARSIDRKYNISGQAYNGAKAAGGAISKLMGSGSSGERTQTAIAQSSEDVR